MCWRLALLGLLAGILGCHHSHNRIDPVFGRQVIPPPGTGTAGTAVLPSNEPPPASYYEGGSQLPRTSSTGSPTVDPYSPPGGSYQYGGNSTAQSSSTGTPTNDQGFRPPNVGGTTATATTTSTTRAAGVPLKATGPDDASRRYESTDSSAGFAPNTNTSVTGSAPASSSTRLPTPPPTTNNHIPPQSAPSTAPATNSGSSSQPAPYPTTGSLPPRSASLTSSDVEPVAFREPRRLTPDDNARAIGEVADARTYRDDEYDPSGSTGTLRTASYQRWEGEPGTEARTAAAQPEFVPGSSKIVPRRLASGPYGYDEENYTWLKGKLEYSLAQKQWKLRYIPISEPMDEFGGSVVLEDIDALGDTFRPGDYVTVEGTLAEVEESPGNFAPRYTIKAIERTGK